MYKIGSTFKFDYEHDGIIEKGHSFILAKSFEHGYAFQIVCIDGYHKGAIEGYVKNENGNRTSVSEEHFIAEMNRNFMNIHWDTFEKI